MAIVLIETCYKFSKLIQPITNYPCHRVRFYRENITFDFDSNNPFVHNTLTLMEGRLHFLSMSST
jgi:hypothetical protein